MDKNVAWVVTDYEKPLDQSSLEVIKDLQSKKISVQIVSWLDKELDLKNYDLIILNGCSGYHKKIDQFRYWLKSLSPQIAQKVHNNIPKTLWNLDKTYLLDLRQQGFDIVDSIWVEKNSVVDLKTTIENKNWQKFIVKPTISAGSYNTKVFTIDQIFDAEKLVKLISKDSGVIIQNFMEIIAAGEFSAIFFDKKFSHIILKIPKNGDFRAGIKQGAKIEILNPAQHQEVINYATKLVNKINDDLLYSRVDMIKIESAIYLMELEIIEPILYLASEKKLIENYTKQILLKLNNN